MSDRSRKLRSQSWFGGTGRNAMMHRSWMKNEGMPADSFRRPAGDRDLQHLV